MSKVKEFAGITVGVPAASIAITIATILLMPLWAVAKTLERLDARR